MKEFIFVPPGICKIIIDTVVDICCHLSSPRVALPLYSGEGYAIIQQTKGSKMLKQISLPAADEYADFYTDYVQRASQRDDIYTALPDQIDELRSAVGQLSDAQALFKPRPKEWSIKEVMGHLNDVERVFSYR